MTNARYGSDLMVDMLHRFGFRYVSLNPGSSYRGLHDSIVNYGGNVPQIITCPHEKIAVGLAHGYAKASGEPMAVILHDLVGLLHGSMGVYYAHIDRAPVVIYGGAGPMDVTRRRPNIDWIHSANVQGDAVRDFTKWDDQPATLSSVPQAMARAWRVALSQPQGPTYVALDAGLQEDEIHGEIHGEIPLPDTDRLRPPTPMGADPAALRELARLLTGAERPILIPGYAGRDPRAFEQLVELAELLAAGVVDTNARNNLPNRHPLNVTGSRALEEADLVCFIDTKDMGRSTQTLDSTTRAVTSRIPPGAKVVDLGFNDLALSSWSQDYAELIETDLQVTADTAVALPQLLDLCRELVAAQPGRAAARQQRRRALAATHERTWEVWRAQARENWDASPVSTARLAAEVWEVVKDHDWVLTAGTANEWAMRTWDIDKHYRHPGKSIGTATQIGISLGVALAHRDHNRLVVDLQPDGDLMFDPGALWVASYHKIPLLVVMYNNRSYYNDHEHQERLAKLRGTPVENAYLGMELDNPPPDFGALARSFGWHGEGPITDPEQVQPAVRKAAEIVTTTGRPALVDVVCQPR